MLARFLALSAICVVSATNAAGTKFLEENGAKEGVVTLPSGLQYKIVESGKGAFHPTVDSPCECHYEGRTASNFPAGPKFDSSYDRGSPTTFAPNQVIKVPPDPSNSSTSRALLHSVGQPRAHPSPP
eukprot:scaffold11157_cov69-Phaeocystis_antarctica.AAC.1